MENPKTVSVFPKIVLQLHRRRRQILGDRSLCFGTLPSPSVSIAVSAVSIDFTAISTNLVVSYDEEGVVLPRG
jgi:hypothetical protein